MRRDPRIGAMSTANRRANTPEQIIERKARRRAEDRLHLERAARYPVVTGDNVDEVLHWQEARLMELYREELDASAGAR